MKTDKLFSLLFVLFIAFGTLGFVWFSVPEEMSARSEDEMVTITGVTRETQPFSVTKTLDAPLSPLAGAQYLLEPSTIVLDVPVKITFANALGDKAAVYRYDDARKMWEEISSVTSLTENSITIETEELGLFALGEKETVAAPEFLTVYDELVRMSPENTVGYETVVGYKKDDGAIVRLPGVGKSGSCGENMSQADGEELSEKQRRATVLVNDVQTPVTFIFLTRWLTSSSAEGCSYDILTQ